MKFFRIHKNYYFIIVVLIAVIISSISIGYILKLLHSKKLVYVLKINDIISYEGLDIDSMYNFLKKFKGDGIILYIDSPGGGLETYKIVNALKNLNVPKLCYVHYYATSAAYWICSQADYIIAEPHSVVGSVGGIIEIISYSRLFEKLGIDVVIVKEGEYKDVGNPFRNITEEEKELLRKKLNLIVEEFRNDVKSKRNLTNESLVFSGLWFLGIESIDIGLVDSLGDFEDAKERISSMLNTSLDNIEFVFISFEKKESLFEKLSRVFISEFYKLILRDLEVVVYS